MNQFKSHQLQTVDGIDESTKSQLLDALAKRRARLLELPVTHRADIELREQLIRELDAEAKLLKGEDS